MFSLPQEKRVIIMSESKQSRKTLFIQKQYQLKSILTVIAMIAISGIISGIILYLLLSSELAAELQAAHTNLKNTSDSLAPAIILGNIVTILITGTVAAIAVLYQSHKIAGPLYRIKTICDDVSEGKYETMTSLRKDDQLIDLASSFEKMLSSIKARHTKSQSLIKIAKDKVELLQAQAADEQTKAKLKELNSSLSQISEC